MHLSADRRCRPLSFVLTPGQAGDSPQFRMALERIKVRLRVGRPRTRPDAVAADRAYSSRGNRIYLRRRRIKAVIPEKTDQAAHRKKRGSRGGRPVDHNQDLYKLRNAVERCINRIKEWRGLAFRFDKTPDSYLAGLHLRGTILWIRSLQPTLRSDVRSDPRTPVTLPIHSDDQPSSPFRARRTLGHWSPAAKYALTSGWKTSYRHRYTPKALPSASAACQRARRGSWSPGTSNRRAS